MSYKVAIRNNGTGEIRKHECSSDWRFPNDRSSGDIWCWIDGNESCSCNLCDFWHEAGAEQEWEEERCSSGRFTPLYAELPDGQVIPLEERWKEENP